VRLFCSYHVSQQNTFTGRLTPRSFDAVLAKVKRHLARRAMVKMPLMGIPASLRAALVALLTLAGLPAAAEVRPGTFRSESLGHDVSYVVDVPPSYDGSGSRKYPVVYALHGLFEGSGFWERRGLAPILARLRETGAVPEFLVVAVDGGNSFFVNAPGGRYEDLVTKDLVAHVEATYRVVPAGRGGAPGRVDGRLRGPARRLRPAGPLRRGGHPQRHAPRAHPLGRSGRRALAHGRLQQGLRRPDRPCALGRERPARPSQEGRPQGGPRPLPGLRAEDRFGLASGHRELHRILDERGVAHEFELPPGDHGYEFVRARLEKSLRFLGNALKP